MSDKKRQEIATAGAKSVELADVDNDKKLDIVFANYDGEESWAYLNKKGKFSAENRLSFETSKGVDSVVIDFNLDGFADVFFTNHDRGGYRVTD